VTADWTVPVWAVLAAVGVVVLMVAGLAFSVARSRRRTAAALAVARQDAEALREQVAAIERRLAEPARHRADDSEYTITTIGREEPEPVRVPVVPAPLFADLVLRESAVQAASFVAGLRRALAPETRNRIRFEMRQEVKRARRQRRADLRQARREFEAKQRAAA
jgi:hypothetical protein